jgi:drug/metabolite transporter (DMT)-like permease
VTASATATRSTEPSWSRRATPEATRWAWIAWSAICVIWGTTYLAIKVGLNTVPPFLIGGFRYLSGGLILAAILRARGHRLPSRAAWGPLAVLGVFMLLIGNGGVVWGEQFVPSGLTAVLIATSPFWMVTVDALFPGGRHLRARQWLGLLTGFAGILLLVWPDVAAGGAIHLAFMAGVVALQLACAGWAIGSAYMRRHVMPDDVLGSAAVQMIFGGLFRLLTGSCLGEWGRLSFTGATFAAVAYLSLAGSVVAFSAYNYALQHLEIAVVSLYTYINPIIAVALGTVLLGEPFHLRMLVAAGIIVGGVLIVGPVKSQ